MKDSPEIEIRRNNLRYLATTYFPMVKEAAALFGFSESMFSQMIGKHPIRSVTANTARHVEMIMDLPQGWMDHPHTKLYEKKMSMAGDTFGQVFDRLPLAVRRALIETAMQHGDTEVRSRLKHCLTDIVRLEALRAELDKDLQTTA